MQRQVDLCDLGARLVCQVGSRTARAVIQTNPILKKKCFSTTLIELDMVVYTITPWRISEFEASLVYKASSMSARTVIQRNPVLKSKKINK